MAGNIKHNLEIDTIAPDSTGSTSPFPPYTLMCVFLEELFFDPLKIVEETITPPKSQPRDPGIDSNNLEIVVLSTISISKYFEFISQR